MKFPYTVNYNGVIYPTGTEVPVEKTADNKEGEKSGAASKAETKNTRRGKRTDS